MKLCNDLYLAKAKQGFTAGKSWRQALEALLQMMAPFAPHAAEQLLHDLGHEDSVHIDHWPIHDPKFLVEDIITIAVQVNGKLRGTIEIARDASSEAALAAAKSNEQVVNFLDGKTPKKEIYVPGKIVNLVV